jgi:hypothetical protein
MRRAYGCAVNPETIDGEYSKFESEVEAITQAIERLAGELQTAATSGDAKAARAVHGWGVRPRYAVGAGFGLGDDIINGIFHCSAVLPPAVDGAVTPRYT